MTQNHIFLFASIFCVASKNRGERRIRTNRLFFLGLSTHLEGMYSNSSSYTTSKQRVTTVVYFIERARSSHDLIDHASPSEFLVATPNDRVQCKSTRSGLTYNGTLSYSHTGEQCLLWSRIHTNQTPAPSSKNNYCRNYDSDVIGPYKKSVFTTNSMVHCDKTIHPIVLKFSMVLDIGLGILNPFLNCE